MNAARFARLRRIRQHTHADADADSYGVRMENAVALAESDAARADAYNGTYTQDADAFTEPDALHMAATWQVFT